MTNQEKKMIQYFEKELSFLSDCDPNQYDDLEVLHKDVLAAANCSIAISQIKIADALDTIACHMVQVDNWLEGIVDRLEHINTPISDRLTQMEVHLGFICETLNKKEG